MPGSTLAWTVAHRGREGTDVMAVKIGAPGATVAAAHAVTDGNTQWGVYSGSYVVPAGQSITRFEFEAISSAGGDPGSGNLVDAISFSLPCDYGDAPDSYGTTAGSNGASHLIASTLALGSAAPDAEGTGFPSAGADGDNLNNSDDENSLTSLPVLRTSDTSYSLSAIPVLNTTGSAVTLVGWIDFNRNGAFEAGELATAVVSSSRAAQQTAT